MIETLLTNLEQRLGGRLYAKQRLGIETDHEAQIFGQGLTFFHIENWYSIHSVIRTLFKLTGLYWRGQANAARVQVRRNDIRCKKLPPAFDGFTLLHMTDFHADMNDGAMRRLEAVLPTLSYDLCVLTGDYRGSTFGKVDDVLARMRRDTKIVTQGGQYRFQPAHRAIIHVGVEVGHMKQREAIKRRRQLLAADIVTADLYARSVGLSAPIQPRQFEQSADD